MPAQKIPVARAPATQVGQLLHFGSSSNLARSIDSLKSSSTFQFVRSA